MPCSAPPGRWAMVLVFGMVGMQSHRTVIAWLQAPANAPNDNWMILIIVEISSCECKKRISLIAFDTLVSVGRKAPTAGTCRIPQRLTVHVVCVGVPYYYHRRIFVSIFSFSAIVYAYFTPFRTLSHFARIEQTLHVWICMYIPCGNEKKLIPSFFLYCIYWS